MDVMLTKLPGGVLGPMDETQVELLNRLPADTLLRCKLTRVRNPRFHRKFFALVQVGFDAFEPIAEYKGFSIEKNLKAFREDVTIMAGYYIATMRPDGTARLRAKSISFASMDQTEFENLYNAVANVLLQKVLARYTRADLDAVVYRLVGF
ncbi:DUF1367 family protein [Paraburkholderia sediminicola]|uniref:DUF1367 family protein n=1 Tax=Paraburkholderia sediminicola TaxID=458836 RepID=UPI0038BC5C46